MAATRFRPLNIMVFSMKEEVDAFWKENGFERDASRAELGNIITSPAAQKIMFFFIHSF